MPSTKIILPVINSYNHNSYESYPDLQNLVDLIYINILKVEYKIYLDNYLLHCKQRDKERMNIK